MKKALLYIILSLFVINSYGQDALNFYITFDSGYKSPQVRWPYDTVYFNDSVWVYIDTVNNTRNQWKIGRPQKTVFDSAYSYPNAIVTDTAHPCLPNDTSVFILKVPQNAWLGLAELSFKYKLDIDTGDIAFIEYSADTGYHWTNVLTDSNGLFSFIGSIPDLTKSTVGWKSISLNPMYPPWQSLNSTGTYFIRFTFITDSNTTPRDGWMIDNIFMGYYGEGVPIVSNKTSINLYPNPVIASIFITSNDKITSITITNLIGQTVYNNSYHNEEVQIDVSALPAGMYLIRINGTEVRKFVKE